MLMIYNLECRIVSSLIWKKPDWSETTKEIKLVALIDKRELESTAGWFYRVASGELFYFA